MWPKINFSKTPNWLKKAGGMLRKISGCLVDYLIVLVIFGLHEWLLLLLCFSVYEVIRIFIVRRLLVIRYNLSGQLLTPTDKTSEVDKKAEYAVQAALKNHIVLQQIFSNLKLHDLKQCRLVNKFWESEAGSYIRRFRKCNVYIRGPTRCSDVKVLAKVISETTFVPIINSLSLSFYEDHREDGCKSQSNAIGELTKKLSLKYLEIHGNGGSERNVGPVQCPAIELVVRLLREKLTDVIELTFDEFPGSYETYFEEDWTPALPRLKALHVGTTDFAFEKWKNMKDFVAKILRDSPNLQKIKAVVETWRVLRVLPKEKYSLLDNFFLYMGSDEQEKYCLELAQAEPKLLSLWVRLPSSLERRYLESSLGIVEELMISSVETLEELQIIIVSFPTEFLNFPPMVRVKKLKFSGENDLSLPQLLAMLRCIDYSKMLPSLSTVCLNVRLDAEELQNPWGNDEAAAGIVHRAATVKTLDVVADFAELTFQDLSTIFPELSSLRVSVPWGTAGPVPYEDLFTSWPRLEVLYVSEGIEALRTNLDSHFLGIHPEEVEVLREMDDESLEKMHIVPIRPSLLTMQCLKTLHFYISARDAVAGEVPPDQVFVSKLTGIVALRKMIGKGIEIHFSGGGEMLSHLRPFASKNGGSSVLRFFAGI